MLPFFFLVCFLHKLNCVLQSIILLYIKKKHYIMVYSGRYLYVHVHVVYLPNHFSFCSQVLNILESKSLDDQDFEDDVTFLHEKLKLSLQDLRCG